MLLLLRRRRRRRRRAAAALLPRCRTRILTPRGIVHKVVNTHDAASNAALPQQLSGGYMKQMCMVAALVTALTGCVSDMGNKQIAGGLIGAAGGGLLGSQIGSGRGQMAAIAAGTLLGAFAGSEIGKSLDRADRMHMQQAEYTAYSAPVGQRVQWSNPQSGNYGYITPMRDGRDAMTGAYCREFQQTIIVGGRQQAAYGTSCQQPDGSWRITQ